MARRSDADTPADRVVRLTFLLRMVAVALALLHQVDGAAPPAASTTVALLLATITSFVALRCWPRLGPVLRRHPSVLAIDVAVALGLLGVAGPTSPMFHYTLATALLGGALHGARGGATTATALWLGYLGISSLGPAPVPGTFLLAVGLPALYPLAGFGAAGLAAVLREQVAAATARVAREGRSAAAEERARLARDLHDSVAATTQGVALQVQVLARALAVSGHPLATAATAAEEGAWTAAREARQALVALRAGRPGTVLDREVAAVVHEAVRNAARHAPGATVTVTSAVTAAGQAEVVVHDDGPGFDASLRPAQARAEGHFGLVGMGERIAHLGGDLRIASTPGGGTTVVLRLPAAPEAVAS